MGRRARGGGLPEPAFEKSSGLYYREIGKKVKADGGYRQHKFYLGADKPQAVIRVLRLETVWDGVCKRWSRLRNTPEPLWCEISLQIARTVSRGEDVCRLELPDSQSGYLLTHGDSLAEWQADFPSVRLVLADSPAAWKEVAPRTPTAAKRTTLHAALTAFREYLRQKKTDNEGRLSISGHTAVKEVDFIMSHAEDLPLSALDAAALESWEDYWKRRPQTKRGTPCAINTATAAIVRIRAFLRWLHKSKDFPWRKPDDYESQTIKIRATQVENAKRANGHAVKHYTDAELVTLWTHATPIHRLYILLGLNCGFGTAEVATLLRDEIHLDAIHPKYGTRGSWIRRVRGKSQVYGEWLLWPETVEAIKWYLSSVRPQSDSPAFMVSKAGTPVADQISGNSRAQRIPKAWSVLTERIQKTHPEFRSLSFCKLRKTAAHLIEEVSGSGETAGYFLCHGKAVPSDGLLDVYRNRDFRRVHLACEKARERLQPMFAAVPSPFVRVRRTMPLSPEMKAKRDRIVSLRGEGKTFQQIANEMGLSIGAIQKHLNKGGVFVNRRKGRKATRQTEEE